MQPDERKEMDLPLLSRAQAQEGGAGDGHRPTTTNSTTNTPAIDENPARAYEQTTSAGLSQPSTSDQMQTISLGDHVVHIRPAFVPQQSLANPPFPSDYSVANRAEACMALVRFLNSGDLEGVFGHITSTCTSSVSLQLPHSNQTISGHLAVFSSLALLMEVYPDGFHHIISQETNPTPLPPATPPAVTLLTYFEGTKVTAENVCHLNQYLQNAVGEILARGAQVSQPPFSLSLSAVLFATFYRMVVFIEKYRNEHSLSMQVTLAANTPIYIHNSNDFRGVSSNNDNNSSYINNNNYVSSRNTNNHTLVNENLMMNREFVRRRYVWNFYFDSVSGSIARIVIAEQEQPY